MSNLILPPDWQGKSREITPEPVFQNRREFLKMLGISGIGIAAALHAGPAFAQMDWLNFGLLTGDKKLKKEFKKLGGFKRNKSFTARRPMTLEEEALQYNNFYEFTSVKEGVWKLVDDFKPEPWKVEVTGQVNKPVTLDADDLRMKFPLEERILRHRCVETWAMVVPWIGFPLKELIQRVEPKASARYVRFVSFHDPEVAPGQKTVGLPWPYNEGLTIAEANNELAFLAVGIYGHSLPNQHGAPVRLVLPWKYGFKSIKSITRVEFTDQKPATFWNTLVPGEYDFEANVNPDVPHPRWSQRREKMIGTGDVFSTTRYNGYGEWVAKLYS